MSQIIPNLPDILVHHLGLIEEEDHDSLISQLTGVLGDIGDRRRRFGAALASVERLLDYEFEKGIDYHDQPGELSDAVDELSIDTDQGLGHIASALATELAGLHHAEAAAYDYLSAVQSVEAGDPDEDADAAEEAA